MSAGIKAKSAKAPATVACNLLVRVRRGDLSRSFADCFEMGDGVQVLPPLIERVAFDEEFSGTVRNHRDSVPQKLLAAQAFDRLNEQKIRQQ